MSLTDFRFRESAGLVVLQVLEYENDPYGYSSVKAKWRDAKVEDLLDVSRLLRRFQQEDRPYNSMEQ